MGTHRKLSRVLVLAFVALSLGSQASAQTGAVSSAASGTPGAQSTTDSKPLPWKFLASAMGELDPSQWDKSLKSFGDEKHWDCKNIPDCTTIPKGVENLVLATVGDDLGKAKMTYVVIHVADYAATSDKKTTDAWYLYGSKKWDYQRFTGNRVYGSRTILFIFAHLNVKMVSIDDATKQLADVIKKAQEDHTRIKDEVTKKKLNPDEEKVELEKNLRDAGWDDPSLVVEKLIHVPPEIKSTELAKALKANALTIRNPADPAHPIIINIREQGSGEQFQWLGDYGVPSTYANAHYECAVVKRVPANVANFLNILKILGVAQARESYVGIATHTGTVWGAGRINDVGLPSDVSIAGYTVSADQPLKDEERSKFQIGAIGAFNDEPLYWWDASIGIPVHKIKDLQYSSSNNTVVASQVDKQSAYAMFNLMLYPVDLSDPKSNLWPRILAGFPLSSSPWDRLFVGGGVGIPLKPLQNFQFFAGATLNRNKQPSTLSAGSTANSAQLQNDLKIKTTPKFTFGINVPVKSVLDKLLK